MNMKPSPNCFAVIKYFEECHLCAYPDPASPLAKRLQADGLWKSILEGKPIPGDLLTLSGNPWTVGYGSTGSHVKEGMVITQEEAGRLLTADAERFAKDVNSLVTRQITQGHFDALVSFAYNVGSDIDADILPEGLGDSTLLKMLNAGNFVGASMEFEKWNKAGGKRMLGLHRRRIAEKNLFLGRSAAEAIAEAKKLSA